MSDIICGIIITFNPEIEKLKLQIQRLLYQVNFIVVVDNNSDNCEKIVTILEFDNNNIILIKNNNNLGLGAAQNIGIKKAIELHASYILLLDDDSLIEDNFVSNLIKTHIKLQLKGEKVAAVGPIYFNKETKEQYPVTKYFGPFIKRRFPKHSQPCEASFLISSGCLIPIPVLTDVGMMNEELFIDYIDVEWSFRARKKKYKLFVTPTAKMNHMIGEKRLNILGRKVSYHLPLRKYYLFRNSIYMIKCPYISMGYKIREIVFNGLRFFVYLLYSSNKIAFIKYSLFGLLDGFSGKMGHCGHKF
ncbi:MAG: glycosyltransferase family 2 protein [Bacteroidales bacterium]|nr:glycosyltransferase family 2 protein [Bacteroidales bacterium]